MSADSFNERSVSSPPLLSSLTVLSLGLWRSFSCWSYLSLSFPQHLLSQQTHICCISSHWEGNPRACLSSRSRRYLFSCQPPTGSHLLSLPSPHALYIPFPPLTSQHLGLLDSWYQTTLPYRDSLASNSAYCDQLTGPLMPFDCFGPITSILRSIVGIYRSPPSSSVNSPLLSL
jgi:hypothetical protein